MGPPRVKNQASPPLLSLFSLSASFWCPLSSLHSLSRERPPFIHYQQPIYRLSSESRPTRGITARTACVKPPSRLGALHLAFFPSRVSTGNCACTVEFFQRVLREERRSTPLSPNTTQPWRNPPSLRSPRRLRRSRLRTLSRPAILTSSGSYSGPTSCSSCRFVLRVMPRWMEDRAFFTRKHAQTVHRAQKCHVQRLFSSPIPRAFKFFLSFFLFCRSPLRRLGDADPCSLFVSLSHR